MVQPYRPICIDARSTSMVTSQGGMISIMEDGSFVYSPPNGTFTGDDTFVYRLKSDTIYRMPPMTIPACPDVGFEVYSDPATVVLRVRAPAPAPCVGDADADGDTDVFDFGLFAVNFGCGTQ